MVGFLRRELGPVYGLNLQRTTQRIILRIELIIKWKIAGSIWNDGDRIGCSENLNEGNKCSPYHMKTETPKYVL
jgi:hypothetical protein